MSGKGYVRPGQPISARVIQIGLIPDLAIVCCAASGQARCGLQCSRCVVRRERDGSRHHGIRGSPQREAVIRVERRRIHRLAEDYLTGGGNGNVRLPVGRVRRYDGGRDQIGSGSRGERLRRKAGLVRLDQSGWPVRPEDPESSVS